MERRLFEMNVDNIPIGDYIPIHPPHSEGVLMRRQEGGGGAAPAGKPRKLALGRPWPAVRRH